MLGDLAPSGSLNLPHCLYLDSHLLPPLLINGMEAEDDYGNEQQAYWDRGHEKLQGEDDGGVVCAVSRTVTCKTKEENGCPSPSPTGPPQKGKQAPPSLSSYLVSEAQFWGIPTPIYLLCLLPVDVGKANLDTPVTHFSISYQTL